MPRRRPPGGLTPTGLLAACRQAARRPPNRRAPRGRGGFFWGLPQDLRGEIRGEGAKEPCADPSGIGTSKPDLSRIAAAASGPESLASRARRGTPPGNLLVDARGWGGFRPCASHGRLRGPCTRPPLLTEEKAGAARRAAAHAPRGRQEVQPVVGRIVGGAPPARQGSGPRSSRRVFPAREAASPSDGPEWRSEPLLTAMTRNVFVPPK